jgi:hypothetical protein
MSGAQVNLTVVVGGHPARLDGIAVTAPLSFVVARARHQTSNYGRSETDWELRDSSGVVLDLELTIEAAALKDGQLLYLQPRAGAGGDSSAWRAALEEYDRRKAEYDAAVARGEHPPRPVKPHMPGSTWPLVMTARLIAVIQPADDFVQALRAHALMLDVQSITAVLLREAAQRIEDAEAVIEEIEAATPEAREEPAIPLPRTVPRFDGTLEFPRRSCVDQRTPLETALWAVHARIEAMPASPHLTDAGSLLVKAADKLADYLEGVPEVSPGTAAGGEAESMRAQIAKLREALISHRADLHGGSTRPCPTCRQSAAALGIRDMIADSCANHGRVGPNDAAALRSLAARDE